MNKNNFNTMAILFAVSVVFIYGALLISNEPFSFLVYGSSFLFFNLPFVFLIAAVWVGMPNWLAFISGVIGIFYMLIIFLLTKNAGSGYLIMPALGICFSVYGFIVMLISAVITSIKLRLSNRKQRLDNLKHKNESTI